MIKQLACLLAVLATASVAGAQDQGIFVNGIGVLQVEPDIAMFSFSIQGQTDTPADAMQRADAISGDLVRRLERIGIESDDIRSTPVTLNPFVDRQTQRELIRFARTTTAVLRDLDDVAAVNEAALEAGVNSIGGVQYAVANMDELNARARDLALDDARSQAEAIAEKMGVALGRILSIRTSRSRPPQPVQMRGIELAQAAAEPEYRSGLIEVTEDVSATFEIIQP